MKLISGGKDEDHKTKWEALVINLAFMLARLKNLDVDQKSLAAEWLDNQISQSGG
jgi:hypothetical protein